MCKLQRNIFIIAIILLGFGCSRRGYVPLEDMNINEEVVEKQSTSKHLPRENIIFKNVPEPDDPTRKRNIRKQQRVARKRAKQLQWKKWPPGKKGFFAKLLFWK